MKKLLFAPLLLSAACLPSAIHSHLLIQPNQQFILGGDQPGAFRVAAHNTGPVPVEIRERLRSGQLRVITEFRPRQRARLSFGAGSTALLRNKSRQEAVLELDITGSQPSRMQTGPASGDGRP